MKLLILLLAVGALVWLLRGGSRRNVSGVQRSAQGDAAQPMLRCAQCGLHVPGSEALPGRGGVFCGEAHRALYEKEHAPQ